MAYTLSLFEDLPGDAWAAPRRALRQTTAKSLLRQEVEKRYKESHPHAFENLLQSVGRAQRLAARRRDLTAEISRALRAFARGEYLLLVDNQQITHLDERVEIHEDSKIRIVDLVPLMVIDNR